MIAANLPYRGNASSIRGSEETSQRFSKKSKQMMAKEVKRNNRFISEGLINSSLAEQHPLPVYSKCPKAVHYSPQGNPGPKGETGGSTHHLRFASHSGVRILAHSSSHRRGLNSSVPGCCGCGCDSYLFLHCDALLCNSLLRYSLLHSSLRGSLRYSLLRDYLLRDSLLYCSLHYRYSHRPGFLDCCFLDNCPLGDCSLSNGRLHYFLPNDTLRCSLPMGSLLRCLPYCFPSPNKRNYSGLELAALSFDNVHNLPQHLLAKLVHHRFEIHFLKVLVASKGFPTKTQHRVELLSTNQFRLGGTNTRPHRCCCCAGSPGVAAHF